MAEGCSIGKHDIFPARAMIIYHDIYECKKSFRYFEMIKATYEPLFIVERVLREKGRC